MNTNIGVAHKKNTTSGVHISSPAVPSVSSIVLSEEFTVPEIKWYIARKSISTPLIFVVR